MTVPITKWGFVVATVLAVALAAGLALAHLGHDGRQCGTHTNYFRKLAEAAQLRQDVQTPPQPVQNELPATRCFYNAGTLCDNPELRNAYLYALERDILEDAKIALRVYIVADDNGENPIIPDSDTVAQVDFLNNFYKAAGLTFEHELQYIKMSRLRYGALLPTMNCKPEMVGNGVFDQECMGAFSGFDGGDGTGINALCEDQETCDKNNCNYGFLSANANNPAGCTCICRMGAVRTCRRTASDGVCDPVCNLKKYDWDWGDCCVTANRGTCLDPTSPHRNWISAVELKTIVNDAGIDHMSQFVSPFYLEAGAPSLFTGHATFPWDEVVNTPLGGVIFSSSVWGPGKTTAVHEYGHALGLLHPHVGTSDIFDWYLTHGLQDSFCEYTRSFGPSDGPRVSSFPSACYEGQPDTFSGESSDWTGDFCSDTRPTPTVYKCNDPALADCAAGYVTEPCTDCLTGKQWVNTPYANVMGYAADCETRGIDRFFTPQQHGRMRCYADLVYQNWTKQVKPAPVVFTPKATVGAGQSILLTWFRSIRPGFGNTLRYEIQRTPPFSSGNPIVGTTTFTDVSVVPGVLYSYQVVAVSASHHSRASPSSNPVLLPLSDADDLFEWRTVLAQYREELARWETETAGCNVLPTQ